MSGRPPPLGSSGHRALTALILAVAVAVAGCGAAGASDDGALRVGLVPNRQPDSVEAEYGSLGRHLEEKLGMPVELSVPTSYPAVVEALASGRIDLALLGGLTYVQARERADVEPLVTDVNPETGTTKYHSVIVVPADSDVRRVAELRGRTFAFGSASSTSGSLYPSRMLAEAGIDYRDDLGEKVYTGGHDAAAAAVASGKVDAGGMERRILLRLMEDGAIDGSQVRIVATSGPIEGYPWVVRSDLEPGLRERIARAFVELDDPDLLRLLDAEGYERVQPADYDEIERYARELGLLSDGG